MGKREIVFTTRFKKDYKKVKNQTSKVKRFNEVLDYLYNGEEIPKKYKPHRLTGDWAGHLECHIGSDLLLIWTQLLDDGTEIIYLIRLGSHSELFRQPAFLGTFAERIRLHINTYIHTSSF